MTQMTQEYLVHFWRGRVNYWRRVAVPMCVALLLVIVAVFSKLAFWAGWIAAIGLVPAAIAVLCIRSALGGLRFAAGMLKGHEERMAAEQRRNAGGAA